MKSESVNITCTIASSESVTPSCKGAWNLGTACGKCQRCLATAPAEIKLLQRELKMYKEAWIRELGGTLYRKSHLIDALCLTTLMLREELFALKHKMRIDMLNANLAVRDECIALWAQAQADVAAKSDG